MTVDHQRRAGWGRARQWAEWRRHNPSKAESLVQAVLTDLGIPFLVEYEIRHSDGRPQWIDIYLPGHSLAIEVDGSHGWHNYNGSDTKMGLYDELKTRYCETHGIHFLSIGAYYFHRTPEESKIRIRVAIETAIGSTQTDCNKIF
jgi:hypothetical protein